MVFTMTCKETKRNVIELLGEGHSSPATERHIEQCNNCGRVLKSLRKTLALLDDWGALPPSPGFLPRLKARIKNERESESKCTWTESFPVVDRLSR